MRRETPKGLRRRTPRSRAYHQVLYHFYTAPSGIVVQEPIVATLTIVLTIYLFYLFGCSLSFRNTGWPMSKAVYVIDEGAVATAALHPLRLEILSQLSEPESAAGLARRIGMPRQQVNYHIRQLEDQGLVKLVGERRVRNCLERLVQAVGRSYVISPAALGSIAADPERIEDVGSADYLVALVSQIVQDVAILQREPAQRGKDVRTLALRADIGFRSQKAQNEFANELAEDVARLVEKYHAPRASKERRLRVFAGAFSTPHDK